MARVGHTHPTFPSRPRNTAPLHISRHSTPWTSAATAEHPGERGTSKRIGSGASMKGYSRCYPFSSKRSAQFSSGSSKRKPASRARRGATRWLARTSSSAFSHPSTGDRRFQRLSDAGEGPEASVGGPEASVGAVPIAVGRSPRWAKQGLLGPDAAPNGAPASGRCTCAHQQTCRTAALRFTRFAARHSVPRCERCDVRRHWRTPAIATRSTDLLVHKRRTPKRLEALAT